MDKTTRAIEMLNLLKERGYDLQDVIDMLYQYQANNHNQNSQDVDQHNLEVHVNHILTSLGMPANLTGYRYCKEAIIFAYYQKEADIQISKKIYPQVAEKWNTTPARVERCIRHAIEVIFDSGNVELIEKYFGLTIPYRRGKVTNGEFIATLVEILKLEDC